MKLSNSQAREDRIIGLGGRNVRVLISARSERKNTDRSVCATKTRKSKDRSICATKAKKKAVGRQWHKAGMSELLMGLGIADGFCGAFAFLHD